MERLFRADNGRSSELKFELVACCGRKPFLKEGGSDGADLLNLGIGQRAWCKRAEFFCCPQRPGGLLSLKQADELLYLDGLGWQRSSRSFAGCVIYLPSVGDESEKAVAVSECRLD